MSKFVFIITLILLSLVIAAPVPAAAQQPILLQCGDVVEAELTPDNSPQTYALAIPAGTKLNGYVEPIAENFNIQLSLRDAGGSTFTVLNSTTAGGREELFDLTLPSSNSTLWIAGLEPGSTSPTDARTCCNGYGDYFGAYTIYLGCTLRDGTVIEPGDSGQGGGTTPTVIQPAFSGVGFPGLAAKDFADGITIPLTLDVPNSGAINPGFDSVFGFTFSATAGDVMNLSFARLSGNLNLGLAVLGPDNQIAFQASLVTSETLTTRFSLPAAGDYTIGVFRIDLVPPDTPENTAFQITGTLNP